MRRASTLVLEGDKESRHITNLAAESRCRQWPQKCGFVRHSPISELQKNERSASPLVHRAVMRLKRWQIERHVATGEV
jgi:hypothetical protein